MRRTIATVVLALCPLLTWASSAHADNVIVAGSEGGGAESDVWVNRRLLTTGLVLFGGSYIPAIAVGAESARPSDNPNLFIPVAGPWIDLGERDCSGSHPCSGDAGNKALLIIDGIGQGLGALAILSSFVVHERHRNWFIIGNETVHASPTTVGTGYGLAAAGHF
jgi:hypothetical protein